MSNVKARRARLEYDALFKSKAPHSKNSNNLAVRHMYGQCETMLDLIRRLEKELKRKFLLQPLTPEFKIFLNATIVRILIIFTSFHTSATNLRFVIGGRYTSQNKLMICLKTDLVHGIRSHLKIFYGVL